MEDAGGMFEVRCGYGRIIAYPMEHDSRRPGGIAQFVRRNRLFFLIFGLAAIGFRVFFLLKFRLLTDDSFVYGEIAKNWLQHGVFGQSGSQGPEPTFIRMPGYPIFLILVWLLAGVEHYTAVLVAQIAVDVATCFVIADLARRIASERAAKVAFAVAALCPFFANYATAALTETLSIFFAALAMNFAVAAFDEPARKRWWVVCGVAIGCGILTRPDGGMRAFHVFQPLTPFSASMPWEFVPHGFQQWARTWIADYSSLEDVWFKVDGGEVTVGDLPPRAFDNDAQRQKTDGLLQAYVQNGNVISPAVDMGFAELARERIHDRPLRYYVTLPMMRAADLWLRPRTEMLPIDPHWWRLREDDPPQFWWSVVLGAINLTYVLAAIVAVLRGQIRYATFFVMFALLRTAFLAWMPNPEPRYVLECYPALIAMAAATLKRGRISDTSWRAASSESR
jgi:hypothetical protein